MRRERTGSGASALRWPIPVGALAAGCGLAVLVYQAGAIPLPTRHSSPAAQGPVARLLVPASADAPPRTVLRPADVTHQLLVAVQLAPAADAGRPASSRVTHVLAASHPIVLLPVGRHSAPTSLAFGAGLPLSGITMPLVPGVPAGAGTTTGAGTATDPGTPTDPGTTTGPGTTSTDPGTTPAAPVTTTTDPGTTPTAPGTTTTDPGTTPAAPGTTTTDPGTTPTAPGTTSTLTAPGTATTTTTTTTTDPTPPPAV